MKPLPIEGRFDSAALNFVLHRLPGSQSQKAMAVRNVATVFAPQGVLFGGTVLGLTERHSRPARAVLRVFNRQGAFDNRGDTAEGLRAILEDSFEDVTIDVVGSTGGCRDENERDQVGDFVCRRGYVSLLRLPDR